MLIVQLDRALPLANSTEMEWLDIATGNVGSNESCFLAAFNGSQVRYVFIAFSLSSSLSLPHSLTLICILLFD
jgi:hypothetical protein